VHAFRNAAAIMKAEDARRFGSGRGQLHREMEAQAVRGTRVRRVGDCFSAQASCWRQIQV
jgi:hypothetical protein